MPQPTPGTVINARVRWLNSATPPAIATQFFIFSPTLAIHQLPSVLEETTPDEKDKDVSIVKLRVLVPPTITLKFPTGVTFKIVNLQQVPVGEGTYQ